MPIFDPNAKFKVYKGDKLIYTNAPSGSFGDALAWFMKNDDGMPESEMDKVKGLKLEAVVASKTAMEAMINSELTMYVVATSKTVMNAVAASKTAMDAVTASKTAMFAVLASGTAMYVVANSKIAMDAVVASKVAMNVVVNSKTAMDAVVASKVAMNVVVNSKTAMEEVAASKTAIESLIDSPNTKRNNTDKIYSSKGLLLLGSIKDRTYKSNVLDNSNPSGFNNKEVKYIAKEAYEKCKTYNSKFGLAHILFQDLPIVFTMLDDWNSNSLIYYEL